MSRNGTDSMNMLQKEIRKQFGSAGTSRFVKSLPNFKVDNDVPDRFADLLGELDQAEADRRGSRMTGTGRR